MKKIIIILCVILVCILVGCNAEPRKQLLGYWVSSDQLDSISFDEHSKVVVNGKYIGEYSIYDEDSLAIQVDTPLLDDVYDILMSATFCVKGNILQITDNDTHKVYNFYRENHLEKLRNEEYQLLYRGKPCEGYMAYPFAYPEEWDFQLDGTFLEEKVSKEMLEKDAQNVLKIVKEEIVPLYANSTLLGNEAFIYTCECACILWDEICYKVHFDFRGMNISDGDFIINPNNRYIYVPDDEGIYYLWDGMIKGNSLLQYI